ncbi:MAG: hypothetical protein NTZ05_03310 [Chloroflexi bacterium]|nr:hypothetical protein [Chloroflexota bacterium]
MAELNPEVAKLVVQALGELNVPAIIHGVTGSELPVDAGKSVDAYGAAFQRLYQLMEGAVRSEGARRLG